MSPAHRVLVIGVGSIGRRHTRCFLQTDRARVAICELDDRLRNAVGDEYDIQERFADLSEALAAPKFDAAIICTPAHLHIPMAIQLAAAGIHLLLEKPLSTNFDGLDELRATIDRNQLQAAVAYVLRQHPLLRAAKQAIDEGRFGAPVQLVAHGGQHFPTYRPAYREIYYNNHATGGGAIQDGLTHTLNSGEWLAGPITSLAADAEHLILEGVEVEDTAHVITRQGSGVLGTYSINQHQACNESVINVICRQGVVRVEFHRLRWGWVERPEEPWTFKSCGDLARDQLFINQANAFLDKLEGVENDLCSLDEAEQTLRACLAVLDSAATKQWREVSPATNP